MKYMIGVFTIKNTKRMRYVKIDICDRCLTLIGVLPHTLIRKSMKFEILSVHLPTYENVFHIAGGGLYFHILNKFIYLCLL